MLSTTMKFANKLDESFVNGYKNIIPPWGPVGYVTYKRTYARRIDNDPNNTEEWYQTVARSVNGIIKIGARFTLEEAQRLFDHVFNFRMNFSGRALWQLGTENVEKIGGDSLNNCWLVNINDPIDPFTFTMNQLMLGGGVGYNLQTSNVYSLPIIKYLPNISRDDRHDVGFIVPDNREGWVKLLKKILTSYFYTGKSFTYSTVCIRSKGVPIRTFGGVASGPEDLVKGIEDIQTILKNRVYQKLRPIDCLDIMNIIGRVVVAGNVRRSAQLALGDHIDTEFLRAKRWDLGHIPNWRKHSNNSVVCEDTRSLPKEFWEGYEGNGEPYGLINLKLCRERGRTKEYINDNKIQGTNPCGEIPLESYECCNLGQIYLPNCNIKEFHEVAELNYKILKAISCQKYSDPKSQEVISRNHRLGISVTGVLQSKFEYQDFNSVYRHIKSLDLEYSKQLKIEPSIKLTTIQPDGTKSLLPGVTPGIHPGFAPYFIRRIRFSSNDPIVDLARDKGYHIELQTNFDGKTDPETSIISFPCRFPSGTMFAKQTPAIGQLELQKKLQESWADNSISQTVYYKKEELEDIKKWLHENYREGIKTCSFLLHQDHGFKQAPYEEISMEKYYEMLNNITPIHQINNITEDNESSCEGGACPIK